LSSTRLRTTLPDASSQPESRSTSPAGSIRLSRHKKASASPRRLFCIGWFGFESDRQSGAPKSKTPSFAGRSF